MVKQAKAIPQKETQQDGQAVDITTFSTEKLEVLFGRLMRQRTQLQQQVNVINNDLQIVDTEINKRADK